MRGTSRVGLLVSQAFGVGDELPEDAGDLRLFWVSLAAAVPHLFGGADGARRRQG
jgi:hypothetical protein